MSATVLVSGKLFRDPERKISGAGKTYGSATIKDVSGTAFVVAEFRADENLAESPLYARLKDLGKASTNISRESTSREMQGWEVVRYQDRDYVTSIYREVESAIQDGMNRLAKQRRFPIFA